MVTVQDYRLQKQELRNFLRNSDIIPIATRGVTTITEQFNGTGAQFAFVLTNTGVKNIRSITVNSIAVDYGRDYTFSESTSAVTTVTFISAPDIGIANIDITYDKGTGDKIYDDFPQDFLTIKSYPRIGFDIITNNLSDIALGATAFQNNLLIQISIVGIGKSQVEDYLNTIKQLIRTNAQSLYYINYITIDSIGPLIPSEVEGNKVFQRSIDIRAPFEFEL